ncbi:MAG: hypothetical protein AAGD25_38300 [Cyanobacteria bacterium P01_F01_bin.150]
MPDTPAPSPKSVLQEMFGDGILIMLNADCSSLSSIYEDRKRFERLAISSTTLKCWKSDFTSSLAASVTV